MLHKLHGGIEPAAQRMALAPPPSGKRKLVLATSIAETSVTLEDVRVVIDSGLARRPRYDRGAGLTRLVTERASRAAVTQRAGRAARQAQVLRYAFGKRPRRRRCPRMTRPKSSRPTSPACFSAASCGAKPILARLPFLDPPPAAAIDEARKRLSILGAIDSDGRVTDHGRAIAALPLEPRLAHMLIEARERGFATAAADVAALITERGLGGNDPDLELRWRRWRADRSPRAEAARQMAQNWRRRVDASHKVPTGEELGKALALAFPDRVSRRRDSSGEAWQSVGGRGFRLDPASPLARSEWLAVGEVAGRASGARILSAALIGERDLLDLFGDRIEIRNDDQFDPATGSVTPTRSRRLGAIRLSSGPDPKPDSEAIAQALLEGVREHGLNLLPWDEAGRQLRHRAALANRLDPDISALDDDTLTERFEEWLKPLFRGKRRLSDLSPSSLRSALEQLLGYAAVRNLDRLTPAEFVSPAGSRHGSIIPRRRPYSRSSCAGAVRPLKPSDDRQWSDAAGAGDHFPRRATDPDHQGPARVLGGQLARRRQGHARALSQTPVA